MIPRPVDQVAKPDIEALKENEVPEGRMLDYKLTLPGTSDDDKKEFLADVSSLANAAGGDLLFGVAEEGGVPTDLVGLEVEDLDAAKLRLDNMIRDGIQPRVPAVQMQGVDGFAKGPILILRVPKSWSSPHVITFKNSSRFYTRTNAGKYQMDVTEIRSAFLHSEAVPERIRRFRDDRLAKIVAGETPVALSARTMVVIHVVPVDGITSGARISIPDAQARRDRFQPPVIADYRTRINMDGLLRYAPDGSSCLGYCQLFRNGCVEAVCWLEDDTNSMILNGTDIEWRVIDATKSYLRFLLEAGITGPTILLLSLMGVKGYRMGLNPMHASYYQGLPMIERDLLLLPDVMVQQSDDDVAAILRPAFDVLWNAAGLPASLNYDQAGKWRQHT